ncbi:MAG: hypothetical protein E6R00_09675 [Gammaproteobacteria bacterium]|nr:MAG: hypothetical protein E6R00_09675 [Gammaproteobacteria bacterium]
MKSNVYVGVRFDAELHSELRDASSVRNLPISKIVREGTALYLKMLKGRTEEAQRKLISDEYNRLAIDLIISTEYPADRDRLIDEAVRRAEAVNASA